MSILLDDKEIEGVDIACGMVSAENPKEYDADHYYYEHHLNKAQLKKVFKEIGRIYDMGDKDLRLALAYLHQALSEECDGD